ncbi:MAG: hypothetical protein U0667_12540 [Chloroflexota bacterium]
MVGGESARSIGVAARHADWWNIVHTPAQLARRTAQADEACAWRRSGPEHAPPLGVPQRLPGRLDHGRPTAAGARLDTPQPPFAGTPAGLADHLAELVALGFDAFQLVFGDSRTDDIELFLARTLPAFRT